MADPFKHDAPTSSEPALRPWAPRRIAAMALAAFVLAGITALYLQPGFVLTLANQLWTCF